MASFLYLLTTLLLTQNNNCETIQCGKVESCSCKEKEPCTINCIGTDYCSADVSLTCKMSQPCTIICEGTSACGNVEIDGSKATDLTLICEGNDACKGNGAITCGSGDCSVTCTQVNGGDTCNKNLITNDARSFQCSGDCDRLSSSYSLPPTQYPTVKSTPEPTKIPTTNPTVRPTYEPTAEPTHAPTVQTTPPSKATILPTITPSYNPTKKPTALPTSAEILIANPEPTNRPTDRSMEVDQIFTSLGSTLNINIGEISDKNALPFAIFGANAMFVALVVVFVGFVACIVCVLVRQQRTIKHLKDTRQKSHEPAHRHTIVRNEEEEFVDAEEEEAGEPGGTYHSFKNEKLHMQRTDSAHFNGLKNVQMVKLNGARSTTLTPGNIMVDEESTSSEDLVERKDVNDEYTKTETGAIYGNNVEYVKEESVSWIENVMSDDEVIGSDDSDELITKGQETQRESE